MQVGEKILNFNLIYYMIMTYRGSGKNKGERMMCIIENFKGLIEWIQNETNHEEENNEEIILYRFMCGYVYKHNCIFDVSQ